MNWKDARGHRSAAPWAMASERAYSPMPNAPETGTNSSRGAGSSKGGEPTIEHQEIPSPAKLRSDRTPQHATRHETRDGIVQYLRVVLQPAMHRQTKARLRTLQVSRRQPRFHEPAHQQLAAALAPIDEHGGIDAQHEFDQAVIQQWRPDLERMRHAGTVHLGQQTLGQIGVQIEPAQLRQLIQIRTPELPVEPLVVV